MQTMQNDAVMLQCPNDLCKAANHQKDKFCQQCGTHLIKRYLWAVGEAVAAYQIGDLVAERYLLKSGQIFLDTKPGLPPETSYLDISEPLKPYLRLVAYRLQVPQVYGLLPVGQRKAHTAVVLLEQAPIYTDAVPLEGQLMPELTSIWQEATALRQMNWLWQIAQLWQPFSMEGVASSLLEPQLLRVEGGLVRLLQLRLDDADIPSLAQLGQFWSHLIAKARPSIASFLQELCLALQQKELQSPEQLITLLDKGLTELGRTSKKANTSSFTSHSLQISTCTDTGPSRQRNEDACYPPSGTSITKPPDPQALLIICDGIGGHEGGNVASNLAIETLQQQVQQLALDDFNLDATTLSAELENFACVANDKISQRNDSEHRQGRQRMGTTLVMAVGHLHEVYITHVGDSRAYWITRAGCHQITLDDDVASREVRLGYTLYRNALQQPSSGSLVQALGMSASVHPTVQRFVLDEDCVFLLCSDGLSDYDLVEQNWETEILPILEGEIDVVTASQRLVEIGNTQNGHDNVTVGLVHCQVSTLEPESTVSYSVVNQAIETSPASFAAVTTSLQQNTQTQDPTNAAVSTPNTQLLSSGPSVRRPIIPILLGTILLLGLGGALFAYLANRGQIPLGAKIVSSPLETRSPTTVKTPISSSPVTPDLSPGSLLKTTTEVVLSRTASKQNQVIATPNSQRFSSIDGVLPTGSIIQVLGQQTIAQQGSWLRLKVCSISDGDRADTSNLQLKSDIATAKTKNFQSVPTPSNSNLGATGSRLLQPGEEGWIRTSDTKRLILAVSAVEVGQFGKCQPLSPGKVRKSEKL